MEPFSLVILLTVIGVVLVWSIIDARRHRRGRDEDS